MGHATFFGIIGYPTTAFFQVKHWRPVLPRMGNGGLSPCGAPTRPAGSTIPTRIGYARVISPRRASAVKEDGGPGVSVLT